MIYEFSIPTFYHIPKQTTTIAMMRWVGRPMSLCSKIEQSDVGLASVADSLYRQGGERRQGTQCR